MEQSILIIDDSKDIHRLIRSALQEEPWRIESAYDGPEGLELAAAGKFDLILLDLDLPSMNGFEVCRHLKADPFTSGAAVIFLTTLSGTDERACALKLGAADYMTKPFDSENLKNRIGQELRTQLPEYTIATYANNVHFTNRLR
jgi:putative two-component system response regulator